MTFSGITEMIYRYRLWGKCFFYVRETTLLKKIIITFLIRSSFIKRLTLGGLKNGQTFTDTAGGDHKSPCYCAEWLRAHYAVGCRALQALHCLTWWSYVTAASRQVTGVWANTSLNLPLLSKPHPSLVERTHSKPEITALNCLNFWC